MSRRLTAKQQRWIRRFGRGKILLILARQAHQALPLLPDGARHTDQGIALVACKAGLVILVAGDRKKTAWAVAEISDRISRPPDHILLVCSVRCLPDLPDMTAVLPDRRDAAVSLLLTEGHTLSGWDSCLPYLPNLPLIGGAVPAEGGIADPLATDMAELRATLLNTVSETRYPAILRLSRAMDALTQKLSALSGLRPIGEVRLGGNGQPLPALWGELAGYQSVKTARGAGTGFGRAAAVGALVAMLGFGGLAATAGAALLPVINSIRALGQTEPGAPDRFDRLIGFLGHFSEPHGQLWLKGRLLETEALKRVARNGLLAELAARQDQEWRELDRQVTALPVSFSADQIHGLLDHMTRLYNRDTALRRWSGGAQTDAQIQAAFKDLTGLPWPGAAVEVHTMTPAAVIPPPPVNVALWREHLSYVLAERHRRDVQNGPSRRRILQIKSSLAALDRPWATLDPAKIVNDLQELARHLNSDQTRPDPLLEGVLQRLETIPLLGRETAALIRRRHAVWSSALMRDRASVSWGGLSVFRNDTVSALLLQALTQSGERLTALRTQSGQAAQADPAALLQLRTTLLEQAKAPFLPAPWQAALSQAARQIWSERADAWLAGLNDVAGLWQSAALGALTARLSGAQQDRLAARLTPLLRARFDALEQRWQDAAVYRPDADFAAQWNGQAAAAFALWGLRDQDFVGLRYRLFYDRQAAAGVLSDDVAPFIARLQTSGLRGFEAEQARWQNSLQAWEAFTAERGTGAIGALDSYVVDVLTTVTAARCVLTNPFAAPDGADVFSQAAQRLARAVVAACARLTADAR